MAARSNTGVADDVEAEHLDKNGRGQMGPHAILGDDRVPVDCQDGG